MKRPAAKVIDKRPVRLIIFGVLGLLLVAYFFVMTSSAGRGYELKRQTDARAALSEETRQLELNIAQESSAQALSERMKTLGLETSRAVDYAPLGAEHSVAVK